MNFSNLKSLFLLVILLFSNGIEAKKQLPYWISELKSDAKYYQGVGYAPKVKRSQAHYERAKNEALRALGAEISVEIQSSTILISLENDKSLREDFTSVIEARVSSDIEGYEVVDSYEDKKGYWVFVRLSKAKHAQQQAQKRRTAVGVAQSYYEQAQIADARNDKRTAIVQYVKSLDAVKAYFNEDILIEIDDQRIHLIPQIYDRISTIFSEITLEPKTKKSFQTKVGEQFSVETMAIIVKNPLGTIDNFPFVVSCSERAQKFSKNSDKRGIVGVDLKISSPRPKETVEFCIDFERILQESASDYLIRRWLKQIPLQKLTLNYSIAKPTISITSSEQNLGRNRSEKSVASLLANKFEQAQYEIVSQKSDADLEIQINVQTTAKEQLNGIYTTKLTAKIVIKNLKTDKIIYSQYIDNIEGKQLDFNKAGEKAYSDFLNLIEQKIFGEMRFALTKIK